METNIIGALNNLKERDIKPNFSELSRQYGLHRHTIKKYWTEGGKVIKSRNKSSVLDEYKEEIEVILNEAGVNKIGAYEYLIYKYGNICTYSNFKQYTLKHNMKKKKAQTVHVRYETEPGHQIQVDWKESLKIETKTGEIIKFNLFVATLGYSRKHVFIISKTRTTEDVLRCLIETFKYLGGVPREILTDNMSSLVTIFKHDKRKHPEVLAFEKDLGVEIKFCKVRTPETKGKVESANRFISRITAFNKKIENEEELYAIVKRIMKHSNEQNNQTTNLPPNVLFKKEKEYLQPLPNKCLLDDYTLPIFSQKVPNTLLVNYKGRGYSVPKKFIDKKVILKPIENKLYIYYNTELVTIHNITNQKMNYQENHYKEALASNFYNSEKYDIKKLSDKNLELLKELKYD